jgi:predicted glycosyltransferase
MTRWTPARRRIAFYSHDTQGLGHIRRNIELASALVADDPGTDVLLVTGAVEAGSLAVPPNTELVVLPAVTKSRSGDYSSAALRCSLAEILALRGDLIAAAIEAFSPDLLIVDKEARGLRGELDKTLAITPGLTGPGGRRTRLILGLRDVLDAPERTREEWRAAGTTEALLANYDEVWVYGDPSVHDPTSGCVLPQSVHDMVRFTGYLANGRGAGLVPRLGDRFAPHAGHGKYVLCLVGGGQDGADLTRAFVGADLPAGHHGVVVTGPYMKPRLREELEGLTNGRSDLTVHDFVSSTLGLVGKAAAVVTMGGYNSVCEVLASGNPGLIVPRVRPRLEQAVRAEALARRTHLDTLRPEQAHAATLTGWLADAVERPALPHTIDLDGLARVPSLVAGVADRNAVSIPITREVCDVTA